jgi:hypothetical protein
MGEKQLNVIYLIRLVNFFTNIVLFALKPNKFYKQHIVNKLRQSIFWIFSYINNK